ncbi:MAG: three-Cys-motif partner protein TcmP [Ignavibacteria bacterium]|nr:three-Cys-motif partner protein TcmP [Ignavibacteria bacterium]
MNAKFDPIIKVEEDDLYIDDIGEWGESKYRLLGDYCHIFTKSMHDKWDHLVYLDLFSGCGYSKIRNTKKILKGSPLISLSLPNKFTDYIFCEEDEYKYEALYKRINREFKSNKRINIKCIKGNCNKKIDEIIDSMPKYSKSKTVLSLCFVDPYNIEIDFSTIIKLGKFKMDFLILLAFGMDARRNFNYYLKENNTRIEELVNYKTWRKKFTENYNQTNSDFVKFIADEFNARMQEIGYTEPEEFQSIRSTIKNLPLYHLAFYSKDPLGNKLWKQVKKYHSPQQKLF